jgi:serine/threonine-protein kinase
LKRCLEKDRRARVSNIGVARFLMTETIPTSASSIVSDQSPARRKSRIAAAISIGLVSGIVLTAIAVWTVNRLRQQRAPQPVRFAIGLPSDLSTMIGADRDVAISPDGSYVVYRVGPAPQTRLMLRALNELEGHALISIAQIREPFMSPDGRWVAFFTPGELRKVSIIGGAPITICKAPFPRGASWGDDDMIIFGSAEPGVGLSRVPAGGGEPKQLTTVDTGNGESRHSFPFILPGGRGVLLTIFRGVQPEVAVLDLKTGTRTTLLHGGSHAEYTETGHLVYAANGTLRAVRFDLERMQVVSDAVPVVEQMTMATTGEADFALSRHGTLVYVPGGIPTQSVAARSLVWATRQGREEPINAPARPYAVARISPDGTRVALDVRDQKNDIWIWDLTRQTLTALNSDPAVDMSPIWTPDSRRLIWTSNPGGGNPNLFWQAADGTGLPERLTTSSAAQFPTSISRDGMRVVFFEARASSDLGMLSLKDRSTEMLIRSSAEKFGGEISPDGGWIAYQSNESGKPQVYVRPFPAVDTGRTQISTEGGTRPAWAHNGRELFYLDANDLLTSVPVQITGGPFIAGQPTTISSARYYAGATARGYDLRAYDVSRDDQRFLMIKDAAPTGQAAASSLVVVLNWFEELKTKVPSYQR